MGNRRRFKTYFLRGLAVLLPSILTIGIFVWGYKFIQDNISVHINELLVYIIERVPFLLPEWDHVRLVNFWVKGAGSIAGFLIALTAVFVVGALLASVVGKTLWRMFETFLLNIPFLKQVYPYVKQITDFLLAQENKEKFFSRVVAVEYPRKGIWSIGMVTGTGLKQIAKKVEKELLAILIPTSPTPFTGFIIMVPKEETIELDVTIEEAFRFIVSGGVITPGSKLETDLLTGTPAVKPENNTDEN